MLYIVSTPIGNLKDITYRAVETLKQVDLIAAEDTRQTGKLCRHFGISVPLTSYFDYNKSRKGQQILKELQAGKDVALVTDAGTPGISDPGYRVINLARQNNIPMTVIPGPTALIAALTLSGLPSDRFVFEGFLPVKPGARRKRLEGLKKEQRTLILYESPHRLLKALKDIEEVLGDPSVTCARELTKKFEELRQARASALIEHFTKVKPKGEFVLLLTPSSK